MFHQWRMARDEALIIRLKLERASFHRIGVVLRATFGTWRSYVALCHRKQLLHRQSDWLHDTRLVAGCFVRWRDGYARQMEENRKSRIALWFWSLCLQRKVSFTQPVL